MRIGNGFYSTDGYITTKIKDTEMIPIEPTSYPKSRYKFYKLSFDSGTTWVSYKDDQWITIDINNLDDIKNKAMDKATINNLTEVEIEEIRQGSNKLKIGYWQEQNSIDDVLYTDELDLTVALEGYDIIANQNDWSYNLTEDNMGIEYTFNNSGTYTIKRV